MTQGDTVSTQYKVYGKKPDGTLNICRAKPEFRGTGTCKHVDHVNIDSHGADNLVQRYNEEVLAKNFETFRKTNKNNNDFPNTVTEDNIQSHDGGKVLSKKELLEGAGKVAEQFTNEDWKAIQDFYKSYTKRLRTEEIKKHYDSAVDNISTFLKSNDATAVNLRKFLGNKIDPDELSGIIVNEVGAMTKAEKWRFGKKVSVKRVLFSSLDNDMTRERYIASVMFFGGRCCYCNRVLRKNPPPESQASGEHLTPISPENPQDIHGGTRYGNMVLACVKCNKSRGNKELVSWVQSTKCIPEENKKEALGRIQAFRKFALYSEYDREENDRILKVSKEVNEYMNSFRDKSGVFVEGSGEKIKERIKIALYDLKHESR